MRVSARAAPEPSQTAPPSAGAAAAAGAAQTQTAQFAALLAPAPTPAAGKGATTPDQQHQASASRGGNAGTSDSLPDQRADPTDLSTTALLLGLPAVALATPFQTLVTPSGAHIEAPTRAFGLDELGMFGLHAATGSAGASIATSVAGGATLAGYLAPGAELSTAAGMGFAGLPSSPEVATGEDNGVSGPGAMAGPGLVSASMSGEAAASVPTAFVARAGAFADDDATEPALGAAPTTDADLLQAYIASRPKAPVSLLVSDTDGSLQVVAGASAINADAADRLRRLIDETAAEFGRQVGSVTLNGRPLGPDAAPVNGEPGWR
ncbi:MAG TPA: hypothetical protein VGI95_21910 [Caulobacteraceae bacterium]|jgi:hypothetical protein